MFCGFDDRKALQFKRKLSFTRKDVAQAVGFTPKYLWPNGSTIKIYFKMTPEEAMDYAWGQEMWWDQAIRSIRKKGFSEDPLQSELYGQNLSFPQIFHRIIKERIAPLVHLKFEFTDNIEESDMRVGFFDRNGFFFDTFVYLLYGESLFPNEIMDMKTSVATQVKEAVEYRTSQGERITEEDRREIVEVVYTPTIQFNRDRINVMTIIHEFMHSLGMMHEHQNPVQDGKGVFFLENVRCVYGPTLYEQYKTLQDNNMFNSSAYDPDSIMLYDTPGKGTCKGETVDITRDGKPIIGGKRLSKGDIQWLQENYPGEGFEVNDIPESLKSQSYMHWSLQFTMVFVLYFISLWIFFIGFRQVPRFAVWSVRIIALAVFVTIPFYFDRNGKILGLVTILFIAMLWGRRQGMDFASQQFLRFKRFLNVDKTQ